MRRRLRAAWRLLRIAAHVLHGVAVALLRFPSLDVAARHERIRRWAGKLLRVTGVTLEGEGTPRAGGTLLVANHVSWLDIVAIHALCPRARFVSKADVKSWPVLNRLVGAADSLYLERERRRDAMRVMHHIGEALVAGDAVAVFPEGTTGAGHELLPFHANLLQRRAGGAAFLGCRACGQPGGRLRRRHDAAAEPVVGGLRRGAARTGALPAADRQRARRSPRARRARARRDRQGARRRLTQTIGERSSRRK